MNAMDEKDLRRLLRVQGRTDHDPGRRCPDETGIAAYVEHRLPAGDLARFESHLADCDACLEQVTLLVRQPAGGASPIAPQVVSRARNLVKDKPVAWRAPVWRWGAVAATAACIVVAISLQLRAPGVLPTSGGPEPAAPAPAGPPPGPVTPAPSPAAAAPPAAAPQPAAPAPPAVRNSVGKLLQLELQFPAENATVSPGQLEFRWREVPSATYYEVHLVTEDGSVVWQGKAEDTRARPPNDVSLEPEKKYFVWIRAHLSGGGTVKSSAVSFRVGGLQIVR